MTPEFLTPRARFKAKIRTAFATLSSMSGIAFLWRNLVARRGTRILAYHGVEIEPSSPFSVSLNDFEQQIAYLAANFEVVDLNSVLKWQSEGPRSEKPRVVLTFDDGFRNNLDVAVPVLRRYRVPATFFLIAAKLEGTDPRFMDAEEALELSGDGLFQIGSHTLNHRSVARIAEEECEFEIARSREHLEDLLAKPVELFCYPYGTFNDFNSTAVKKLKENGYALACTSVNGTNLPGTDPYRLRRTKVEWSDDLKTFKRLLGGAMDGWFLVDFFLRFLQRPRAVRFGNDKQPVAQTR